VNVVGQFPDEKGLIAPGMSCHFPIRFAPDSLRDYDDEILLQTQAAQPMAIRVKGRREPPSLTCKFRTKNTLKNGLVCIAVCLAVEIVTVNCVQ
jgi:hypothetical protein